MAALCNLGRIDVYVLWEDTDIAKKIRAERTLGLTLHAYRNRENLTISQLAALVNEAEIAIKDMELDRKVISLEMARKLGRVLRFDYRQLQGNI